MRVKQQAALFDTRPLRLPEPTAQPAGPVRSRSAPSPRLCPASRLCVGPRAPRGAAGSTPAAAEESARPCGAAVRAAAWLHAVGFGVRDFVAVVRKASFPCVVLATCTLSRGVPVVVCVFTPLRTAEGKRSPRPPAPAAYSVRAVHVLPKPASRLRSSFSRVAFVACVLAGSLHVSNLRGKRSKS